MSKAPAMPMYWDAYLADTTHLSTEEHGAYLLLLAAMWRRNGAVPDSDKDNARILGLTPAKWRRVKERLLETIAGLRIENGLITQGKLQKTWENTQKKITKNRENGSLGGRPKSRKNNDMAKAKGSVSQKPIESIPEPEPDPTVEDTNVSLSSGYDEPVAPSAEPVRQFDEVSQALEMFNAAARQSGWPIVRVLTSARRAALSARLRESGGLDGWRWALAKAQDSPHCCGRNDRGWVANFDFLTRQSSFTKLMEGNYDNRAQHKNGSSDRHDHRSDAALEQIARLAGLGQAPGYGRA